MCIAHSGVVCPILRAERQTALSVEALLEAFEEPCARIRVVPRILFAPFALVQRGVFVYAAASKPQLM